MSDEQEKLDTIPPEAAPVATHGFLEQFEHLSSASFETLKEVVEGGLQEAERVILMTVGLKLFLLALHNAKSDDFSEEQKNEIETLIHELENTLNINPLT